MASHEFENVLRNWIAEAITDSGRLPEGVDAAAWIAQHAAGWWLVQAGEVLGEATSAIAVLRNRLGEASWELTEVEEAFDALRAHFGFAADAPRRSLSLAARFCLSAQRALLTHVTPALRCVSIDADEQRRRWSIRFCFARTPSDSETDAASCAVTEIVADFPDWTLDERYEVTPPPTKPSFLPWIVYHRCEDVWVEPPP